MMIASSTKSSLIAVIGLLLVGAAACESGSSTEVAGDGGDGEAGVVGTVDAAGSPGSGGAVGDAAAAGGSNDAAGNAEAGSDGGSSGQGDGGGADGSAGADADGGMGGVMETVHFYGRWNQLADRAITVNTGSHVVAQFSGTGVSARFDVSGNQEPNPTLAWRIDQGDWQEGALAADVSLAAALPGGTHEVLLMVRGLDEFKSRWTPPLISSVSFLGFDVVGGAVQPSPRPVRPKIEFLGDSITEGLYIWREHNGQRTVPWCADARRSWASQTAQSLGAEWRQVGFGGQGLLKGGSGGVPPANDAFNWIYKGVARDDWQADLVVINQGTNDGGAAADFRRAYAAFIGTVRVAYPSAKIVAMRPFNGAHAAEIQAEVSARRAAGDAGIFFVDTAGWLGNGDFTDGVHLNDQGSPKAATALTAAIRSLGVL